jgi:aldehyde:ferredoxin oxidoreductase
VNDRLPEHLMQPLAAGGSQGYVPPMAEMLAAYYQARGWDPGTGKPTRETLRALGLEAMAVV